MMLAEVDSPPVPVTFELKACFTMRTWNAPRMLVEATLYKLPCLYVCAFPAGNNIARAECSV